MVLPKPCLYCGGVCLLERETDASTGALVPGYWFLFCDACGYQSGKGAYRDEVILHHNNQAEAVRLSKIVEKARLYAATAPWLPGEHAKLPLIRAEAVLRFVESLCE